MRSTCDTIELRLPDPADAGALFELASQPQLTRFLQWPTHRTIEDSRSYIDDARRLWERRRAFLPCIYRRSDDELLGAVGISHIDRANHRAEIGTWIGLPHQRQGYNRPAKAAIFHCAFEALGLHRLELIVRVDNEHSHGSVERLPGVLHEGVARMRLWQRDEPHDAHVFAITSADWADAAQHYPAVRIVGGAL